MGTFQSFRKAYGALKDSTTVSLAKVNSEFKDLDIAVVKATNHVESPPKERYVRKIFAVTSVVRPRADVAYCIHALARRLAKTRNWIVAMKVLIVIHRTLREGDPTFRDELMTYSHKGQILQIGNFRDDTSPTAWDCSAWVRAYALFIEERLECFRVLKYDIESERLTRAKPGASKVHSRTRLLSGEALLEQLPALQQLLHRLIGCQPEGLACDNFLIQYALALVLKESFKIYCAINDGIINLVDMFFNMPKDDAVKALGIYKKSGQQAENLAEFYEFCKRLDLARTFQFPTLRQPPPSFLATMEEYVSEAPQTSSISNLLEYEVKEETPHKEHEPEPEPEEKHEHPEEEKPEEESQEEPDPKPESPDEPHPLISTDDDLLGLREINPQASELEESNALALAIVQPGKENQPSSSLAFAEFDKTGWELSLVTTPSNINNAPPPETKLAGGFDNLLLDSLYEDENARRQLQLQNAGYGSYGLGADPMQVHNPFDQHQDPFYTSSGFAPSTNVQLAMLAQQQHDLMTMQQQQQQQMMTPYQNASSSQYLHHQHQQSLSVGPGSANPFGDPFNVYPQNTTPHHGHQGLI